LSSAIQTEETSRFFPRRILVPIDGSNNSRRAVETGSEIAKIYGAELSLLFVFPVQTQSTGPPVGITYEPSNEHGEELIYELSKIAKDHHVEPTGHVLRAESSVVEGITKYANEDKTDLIVIGTRGRSGLKRLFLGSVSEGVIRHAHCNVLVVR
jgi:nucleotide-binding universal stress UspA family protein